MISDNVEVTSKLETVGEVVLMLRDRLNKVEDELMKVDNERMPHLYIHYNSKYDEIKAILFVIEGPS